jgi:hypothetical protein
MIILYAAIRLENEVVGAFSAATLVVVSEARDIFVSSKAQICLIN